MRERRREPGQALIEFGILLPVLIVLVVGVVEVGYALLQQQAITNVAREGSNLISRNHTIEDAGTAIGSATASGPVRIENARIVFSVVRLGTAGANHGQPIIVQRHAIGALHAASKVGNPPEAAYQDDHRDYRARDPNNDTTLRVSGPLPGGLTLTARETLYITEVFARRTSIAPFIPLPTTLYAPAYF